MSVIQTVGRPCSICTSRDSVKIDNALIEGTSLAVISARFGVSVSALSRHSNSHLVSALRQSANADHAPAELLARLIAIANDARAARVRSRDTGTLSAELRASDNESKVLIALLDRFGIDDVSLVEMLNDASALMRAVKDFTLQHPAGVELITVIDSHDLSDIADALRELLASSIK